MEKEQLEYHHISSFDQFIPKRFSFVNKYNMCEMIMMDFANSYFNDRYPIGCVNPPDLIYDIVESRQFDLVKNSIVILSNNIASCTRVDFSQYSYWRLLVSKAQKILDVNPNLIKYFGKDRFTLNASLLVNNSSEKVVRMIAEAVKIPEKKLTAWEKIAQNFTDKYKRHQIKSVEPEKMNQEIVSLNARVNSTVAMFPRKRIRCSRDMLTIPAKQFKSTA